MVVDDELDLLMTIVDWLKHQGHDVVPFPNAMQALSHLSAGDPVDILIADLMFHGDRTAGFDFRFVGEPARSGQAWPG